MILTLFPISSSLFSFLLFFFSVNSGTDDSWEDEIIDENNSTDNEDLMDHIDFSSKEAEKVSLLFSAEEKFCLVAALEKIGQFNITVSSEFMSTSYFNALLMVWARALESFANLMECLPSSWFTSIDRFKLWNWLSLAAMKYYESLSEPCLSAMWTFARGIGEHCHKFDLIPHEGHIDSLLRMLEDRNTLEDIRVKSVGLLGLFARLDNQIDLTEVSL